MSKVQESELGESDMKTIWKFTLTITDGQRINMPAGAEILCVQMQGNQPQLWALVDLSEDNLTEMRAIEIHGTGNPIPGGQRRYIGTFQQFRFVWHVFERI